MLNWLAQHPTESTCGALVLIGVLLVILKLAGVIIWSWWIVCSPFIAGAIIAVVIVGLLWLALSGVE